MQNTCCFTGHRYGRLPWASDEKDVRCIILKELLRLRIESLIKEEGISHFISGMAQGVDTYAAELVLEYQENHDITLECALSFPDQSSSWNEGERERYETVIRRADRVTVTEKCFTIDCYSKRNRYMVDRSSTVLSVWDGKPSGTGSTVRYAREKKRKIIIIDPLTFRIYNDFPIFKEIGK